MYADDECHHGRWHPAGPGPLCAQMSFSTASKWGTCLGVKPRTCSGSGTSIATPAVPPSLQRAARMAGSVARPPPPVALVAEEQLPGHAWIETRIAADACLCTRRRGRALPQSASIGVSWTTSPSRRTARAGEVNFKTVQVHAWFLASGVGSSQLCVQTGHEFARPKRLGDVVVGAGLKRAHLLVFVAHGRKQDHWHRAPFAQAPAYLHAVAVGQHELDDRGRGQAEGATVERLPRGAGRVHLKPRPVQHDPQSVQALRLGVAQQDRAPVAHGRRSGSAGEASLQARASARRTRPAYTSADRSSDVQRRHIRPERDPATAPLSIAQKRYASPTRAHVSRQSTYASIN